MTHEPEPNARSLTPSPFPDDDGLADPQLRRSLASAVSGDPAAYLGAIAELCAARLLVPVAATATAEAAESVGIDKLLTVDKEAEMSVVMLKAADGRTAMLAFTGLDSQAAWDQRTRPVPVTLDKVAQTAQSEGADAVLIDMSGPHPLVLEGEVLQHLAAGHRLVAIDDGFGWLQTDPEHTQ